MTAQALITTQDQKFSIEDVQLPEVGPNQVRMRVHFSGVSIGTEFALIRGKLSWGPFPICTGYQATGVIEAVGDDVQEFRVGDKVYARGNDGMSLTDGTQVTPTTGAHASHIVTTVGTNHSPAHLVRDADMATASLFVMPAVGLYGVDMANPRMGDTVVVYGCGQIGLGVLAACVHRGCRVVAVDVHAGRLGLAEEFGADHLINGQKDDVNAALKELSPDGADVVFECTGIPECIDTAITLCKKLGTFVWQGNYGADPLSFRFLTPHGKRLTMYFPCDDGLEPCRRAVVKNIGLRLLPWEKCITHRIAYHDAPPMYDRINQGDADVVGVVIDWREGMTHPT